MISFPDTSFLCALYRPQNNSAQADRFMQRAYPQPLPVSSLVLFEFRQSTRLQICLFGNDRTRGFPKREGEAMLRALKEDLHNRVLELIPVDWAHVHQIAEILSDKHTVNKGHRFADILHVATALHLGANSFLSFDANQRQLAQAEGLNII